MRKVIDAAVEATRIDVGEVVARGYDVHKLSHDVLRVLKACLADQRARWLDAGLDPGEFTQLAVGACERLGYK